MPIAKYKPNTNILASKAANVGLGVLTGGIGGGVAALASGTPLGTLLNIAGTAGDISREKNPKQIGQSLNNSLKVPEIGDSYKEDTAISRRFSVLNQNPIIGLSLGVKALDDPNIPDEIRQEVAPILFQAKHFGNKGKRLF